MRGRTPSANRRVLIDTSAYYALADPQDENHHAAERVMHRLIAEQRHLFTTNILLAEVHALLLQLKAVACTCTRLRANPDPRAILSQHPGTRRPRFVPQQEEMALRRRGADHRLTARAGGGQLYA